MIRSCQGLVLLFPFKAKPLGCKQSHRLHVTTLNSTILTGLSHQVKRAMRRIFHEKRKNYEKTCRLAAAEILLDNEPSPMDVINILLAAKELETETATFLLLKVQNSLRADHHPARWVWRGRLLFSPPSSTSLFFPPPHSSCGF